MVPPIVRLMVALVLHYRAALAINSVATIRPTSGSRGEYVTVTGYALDPSSPTVYATVQGKSECNCMARCLVDPVCLGVSYDASFLCSFNNAGAMATNSSSVPSEGSSSVFWTIDVIDATFSNESDSLVYAFIDSSVDWDTASDMCSRMPGFQLAEFTEPGQEAVALVTSAIGDHWVGLKASAGEAVFVNSEVAFADSALASAPFTLEALDPGKPCYFIKGPDFKVHPCHKGVRYLCQSKTVA